MNPVVRLGLVGLVGVALLGLGTYAGATAEQRWPYPGGSDVVADYDAHVGEDVLLFATVESVDDSAARIRLETDFGPVTFPVRNFDAPVQPGGTVQVYGRLEPGRVINATNVAVVNPSGGSEQFKYAASVVAVGLFVIGFFRHWRVNVRELGLEPRSDG